MRCAPRDAIHGNYLAREAVTLLSASSRGWSTLARVRAVIYDGAVTTHDSTLALGTVQWGMAYGIANRTGQASAADVAHMLELAAQAGIDTLDTARAYGDAEAVIGRAMAGLPSELDRWRVITKVAPDVCGPGSTRESVAVATERSLEASRTHLGTDALDAVLLHRPEHRVACGGAAWDSLRAARDAGRVAAIGVSATSPITALDAVQASDVQVMQVATSLLDRRLVAQGFFELADQRGVEVHVRSAFLQGVAFMDAGALPVGLSGFAPSLAIIDDWAAARSTTCSTAFLAYALSLPVSRVVIGCERPSQLEANLAAVEAARQLATEVSALAESLPALPDNLLDPSQWGALG